MGKGILGKRFVRHRCSEPLDSEIHRQWRQISYGNLRGERAALGDWF